MQPHRSAQVAVVVVVLTAWLPAGAFGATAGGAAAPGNQAEVTLTVTVVDEFDNPISGATVEAEWDGGSDSGQTASNGKVFLDVEEGADVSLTVDHVAYTRNNPLLVSNAEEEEVSMTVYRKSEAEVKVTQDDEPLRNARVLLYKGGNLADRGRTNQDGLYVSEEIERGDYRVLAVKEGYYRNQTDVTVSDSTRVNLQLSEGTVQLTVSVNDDHFNPARSVEGAEVEVENVGTLQTRSSGQQTVSVPVNAQLDVSVTKDGYESETRDVTVRESDREVEFTISREDELNLTAGNSRVVAGENVRLEVVDEYGTPVEGAAVLVDGEQVGSTDGNGVYRVALEAAGNATITAEHDGVTSGEVTIEVISTDEDTPTPTETATGVPTDSPSPTAGDGGLPVPGFGLLPALVALAAAALVTRRRR
jgi:predicted secreted protein